MSQHVYPARKIENMYRNFVGNIPGKQRKIIWDNIKMVQGNMI
jgi:hypothetical protein